MKHKALSQLVCAAVVSGRFQETLLQNPAKAIATGYMGQSFSLLPEEKQALLKIKAQNIEDFAAQVYDWITNQGNSAANQESLSIRYAGVENLIEIPAAVNPNASYYPASVPVHV